MSCIIYFRVHSFRLLQLAVGRRPSLSAECFEGHGVIFGGPMRQKKWLRRHRGFIGRELVISFMYLGAGIEPEGKLSAHLNLIFPLLSHWETPSHWIYSLPQSLRSYS